MPLAPTTLGLVQAGGQAASGIAGSIASIINTNKSIKANKAMAEYAYSKDLEQWQRQNLYNAPSSQMQRFKDAGLNPNLIYGQGNSGNATTMPHYQAPRIEYNYKAPQVLGEAIGAYQDTQVRQAQIDNLKAREDNIYADTVNKNFESIRRSIQNMWLPKEYQVKYERSIADLGKARFGVNIAKHQADMMRIKNAYTERLINKQMEVQDSLISNYNSRNLLNSSLITLNTSRNKTEQNRARNIWWDTQNKIQELYFWGTKKALYEANTNRANAAAEFSRTQTAIAPWSTGIGTLTKLADTGLKFLSFRVPQLRKTWGGGKPPTFTKTVSGKWR